jgi:phosphate transport system protein
MLTASKISNDLERIADEATKIARRTRQINLEPALRIASEIPTMGEVAHEMLHDAITAFLNGNDELAIEVIARDRSVDSINKQLERELTQCMHENPKAISRALHLMTITRAIERIADHATNIAEESFYFHKAQDIRHDPVLKGGAPGTGG